MISADCASTSASVSRAWRIAALREACRNAQARYVAVQRATWPAFRWASASWIAARITCVNDDAPSHDSIAAVSGSCRSATSADVAACRSSPLRELSSASSAPGTPPLAHSRTTRSPATPP
eukprot:2080374-Prymnesium_polylepis.2